jgi:CRISPR-associated protein Csm1
LAVSVKAIEKQLFKVHGTSLYVAIDSIELSHDALMHRDGNSLGKVWGELFMKRDRKKAAKFAEAIKEDYVSFFMPTMMGGEAKRDSITGEEFLSDEKIKNVGNLLLKEITANQIEVGKKLRETNLVVVKEGEPLAYWKDRTHIEPAGLGVTYYFLNDEDELKAMKEKLSASADEVTVITMNGKEGNCDFLHTLDGINNIYGLEFYGGNEIDRKDIPTFEDMCENANLKRLGVLRMDVDNLGLIFQKGIPAERATL